MSTLHLHLAILASITVSLLILISIEDRPVNGQCTTEDCALDYAGQWSRLRPLDLQTIMDAVDDVNLVKSEFFAMKNQLQLEVQLIFSKLDALSETVVSKSAAADDIETSLSSRIDNVTAMAQQIIEDLETKDGQLSTTFGQLSAANDEMRRTWTDQTAYLQSIIDSTTLSLNELNSKTDNLTSSVNDFNRTQHRLNDTWRDQFLVLATNVEQLTTDQASTRIAISSNVESLNESLIESRASLNAVSLAQQELNEAWQNKLQSLTTSLQQVASDQMSTRIAMFLDMQSLNASLRGTTSNVDQLSASLSFINSSRIQDKAALQQFINQQARMAEVNAEQYQKLVEIVGNASAEAETNKLLCEAMSQRLDSSIDTVNATLSDQKRQSDVRHDRMEQGFDLVSRRVAETETSWPIELSMAINKSRELSDAAWEDRLQQLANAISRTEDRATLRWNESYATLTSWLANVTDSLSQTENDFTTRFRRTESSLTSLSSTISSSNVRLDQLSTNVQRVGADVAAVSRTAVRRCRICYNKSGGSSWYCRHQTSSCS